MYHSHDIAFSPTNLLLYGSKNCWNDHRLLYIVAYWVRRCAQWSYVMDVLDCRIEVEESYDLT